MGLLFLGNHSKCPEKNAFPRIHPELGIQWYYTPLSLSQTAPYITTRGRPQILGSIGLPSLTLDLI